MKQNEEVIEIDLWRIIFACLRRWWMIAIISIVFGVGSYIGTKLFITPTYQSTVKLYVNNSDISVGNISISAADLNASSQLVELYEVLLNTKDTLDIVIREAGLDDKYDYKSVMDMLSTGAVNDTQVFKVTVTSVSPTEAQLIASTIGEVLPDVIGDIIDGADARIVEHAVVPTVRVAPSYSKNAMIGALLGFVLSVVLITIIELMDSTIKDESDLLEITDAPILAYIPDFNGGGKNKGKIAYSKNYYKTYTNGGDWE